jgi:hypothetical protein
MRNKLILFAILLTFLLNAFLSAENAGSINFGIHGATGNGSELWKSGYTIGGNIFSYNTPTILWGIQMGYNHKSLEGFPGQMSIIKIVPSCRLKTNTNKSIDFFGQFGFGYFRMSFRAGNTSSSNRWSISSDENKFGFTLGGGSLLTINNNIRFEIFPLINVIASNDDFFTNSYSINIGIFIDHIKK